ncbi:MAG: hypothetical protein LBU13_05400 [Synergistaceae bacterium]|nr:hypothetical protein [Synergistaceae bacterium]
MDAKDNSCVCDLIARMTQETFSEIDSDIIGLRETDENYSAMWQDILNLQEEYPIIKTLFNNDGNITLSADEHKVFLRYFDLKYRTENIERLHIYFQGHTDCFAYLKRIGAI